METMSLWREFEEGCPVLFVDCSVSDRTRARNGYPFPFGDPRLIVLKEPVRHNVHEDGKRDRLEIKERVELTNIILQSAMIIDSFSKKSLRIRCCGHFTLNSFSDMTALIALRWHSL